VAAVITPYREKHTIDAKDAVEYDIEVTWNIVNTNDVPVWIAAGFVVIHRVSRWTTGFDVRKAFTARHDEAWVIYQPAEGFVTDFSVQRHAQFFEPQTSEELSRLLGFVMGSFGGSERKYTRPDREFDVNPGIHCQIKQSKAAVIKGRGTVRFGFETSVEIPPRSTIRYTPILTMPGPGQSKGMGEFWDNYGTPDFDVEIQIFQLAHYGGTEKPMTQFEQQGEVIRREMMRSAFELQLGDEIEEEALRPRFEFDVAPTPRWEERKWDPISETWI